MNTKATYQDKEKSGVFCTGNFNGSIPRTHRFWFEYGIDELEEKGLILPFIEPEPETAPPPQKTLAEIRQEEMEAELTWAMIQRQYHITGDTKRMTINIDDLNGYAIACRDHVTNRNGTLVIVGERPKRPTMRKRKK